MFPIFGRAWLRLLALALLWPTGVSAHGVTLKLYHPLPADSYFHAEFVLHWAEKVATESGNRLHIEIVPGTPPSADGKTLHDRVKDGSVDLALIALHGNAERYPGASVFSLPLSSASAEGSSSALWEYLRTNDLVGSEFRGIRLLGVQHDGATQVHWLSAPADDAAPLRGRKLGVRGGFASSALSSSGALAVTMADGQWVEAANNGALDGVILPWPDLAANKIGGRTKAHALWPARTPWLYPAVYVLAMNPAAFRRLGDDVRQVINANSGLDVSAWMGRVQDAAAAQALTVVAARGHAVAVLPAAQVDGWAAAAESHIASHIAELDKAGLNGKQLVESARALLSEHSPVK